VLAPSAASPRLARAPNPTKCLGDGVTLNNGALSGALALLPALLLGCVPIPPSPQVPDTQAMDALHAQVVELTNQIQDLRMNLTAMRSEQQAVTTELDLQNRALGRVEGNITTLPDSLKTLCPRPPSAQACSEPQTKRVVVSGNKMVVGELEQVWLDPPGTVFDAHVDPTSGNNALHASDIVEFERDGKSWVRFELHPPGAAQSVTLERRVVARRRAFQPPNGESIKRPVVRLHLRLGDVEDTFSFVLTDVTAADYQLQLGRSFLKDIAYLEIGAKYVQPRTKVKPAATKAATAK